MCGWKCINGHMYAYYVPVHESLFINALEYICDAFYHTMNAFIHEIYVYITYKTANHLHIYLIGIIHIDISKIIKYQKFTSQVFCMAHIY